jgi:hypothetical protein
MKKLSILLVMIFSVVTFSGMANAEQECINCNNELWYRDADGDGYGDINDCRCRPNQPEGYVSDSTDCNDNDDTIYPGATEVADDGIDQNCNGYDLVTYFEDSDTDTYGNASSTQTSETGSAPSGYVSDNNDCNDSDPIEHPNQTWYKDTDDDDYSDGTTDTTSCTRPEGYKVVSELTATSGDCDDSDGFMNPGASETCGDGKDSDCNGSDEECDSQFITFEKDFVGLIGNHVEQTTDGGYIFVGTSGAYGGPTHVDILVVKTDEYGEKVDGWGNNGDGTTEIVGEWEREWGASVKEVYDSNEQLDGYIVTGTSYSFSGVYFWPVMVLVRLNNDGTVRSGWGNGKALDESLNPIDGMSAFYITQDIGGSGGSDVIQTEDRNNFVIVGYAQYSGGNGIQMFVVRTDEYGVEDLSFSGDGMVTYLHAGQEFGSVVREVFTEGGAPDGYIIGGRSNSWGNWNMYLLRLTNAGEFMSDWGNVETFDGISVFGSYQEEVAHDVQLTYNHKDEHTGYILVGQTKTFSPNTKDSIYMVKTDLNGEVDPDFGNHATEVGTSVFTTYLDHAYSVKQTGDGGYILLGSTYYGNGRMYLIKTDAAGELEWEQKSFYGEGASVQQTTDGGYIFVGTSGGPKLIKLYPNGSIQCYADTDGDGYGDINTTAVYFDIPAGYVTNGDDCDDTDDTVYPGAPELCDGKDNNCDGQIDEGC